MLGCTATLIFAFLPLLVLPGAAGLFIRSMPVAVVFTILASLLVSLTIVPFLASLLLKESGSTATSLPRGSPGRSILPAGAAPAPWPGRG